MSDKYEEKTMPWKFWGNRTLTFLFYDHWFRFATIGFVLLLIFLAIFLPKIWKVSPEGFTPEYHISGLDKVQAWSLARSARKFAKEGRLADSMHAWRSAIQNSPCDVSLHRGALQTLIDQPLPARDFTSAGLQETLWLLRLTRTNATDVALTARFYDRYGLPEMLVARLDPKSGQLDSAQAKLLLKALFDTGNYVEFEEVWNRYADTLKDDVEVQVYRAAHQAGWGQPGTIHTGRERLEAAKRDPATRLLAHRLALAASLRQGDLEIYRASMEELRQSHSDTVRDNVQLWRLLLLSGRRDEAVELAKAYSNPPKSPWDAQIMVAAFNELGMKDYAAVFLERVIPEFSWSEELPLRLAEQYTQLRRWDELRGLAVQIRNNERIRERLGGYSLFLEGYAQFHLNRMELASDAFSKVPTAGIDNKILAFNTATAMNRLGYPKPAGELLKKFESSFTNRADFYFQLAAAAYESRQSELLIAAATKAYDLDPQNLDYMNNYAAALLVTRTQPEKAIHLTLRLREARPDSVGIRLNHIHALIQNLRLDDAERECRELTGVFLSPTEEASAKLARYEIAYRRGDRETVRRLRTQIDVSRLLEPEIKWLEETTTKMP